MAVKVRTESPVSYQMMIASLRLFAQDEIISNEELEMLEQFKTQSSGKNYQQYSLLVQLNAKELIYGHEALL